MEDMEKILDSRVEALYKMHKFMILLNKWRDNHWIFL
jgi:hypothetical protein